MEYRQCKVCLENKPIDKFPLVKGRWHMHTCFNCRNKKVDPDWKRKFDRERKRRKRMQNPDEVRAYDRNRDRYEQRKTYNEQNRNHIKLIRKLWAASEHGRSVLRNWWSTKRARQVEAFVETVDRNIVFKRDKGVCHLCGELVDAHNWHLDHIIPLARGGKHCYDNVAVSHPFCNMSKGSKIK